MPDTSKEKISELQQTCFDRSCGNNSLTAEHIKQNDHVNEVLTQIAQSDNQQIVISNTRQQDLLWFLDAINIKQFFNDEHVIGVNAHQTHGSKIDALKDYLLDKKFDKIIVIGDSESDLKLGRAVGAITYFYKHPHRQHEQTENADHIINDLRDILREFE